MRVKDLVDFLTWSLFNFTSLNGTESGDSPSLRPEQWAQTDWVGHENWVSSQCVTEVQRLPDSIPSLPSTQDPSRFLFLNWQSTLNTKVTYTTFKGFVVHIRTGWDIPFLVIFFSFALTERNPRPDFLDTLVSLVLPMVSWRLPVTGLKEFIPLMSGHMAFEVSTFELQLGASLRRRLTLRPLNIRESCVHRYPPWISMIVLWVLIWSKGLNVDYVGF